MSCESAAPGGANPHAGTGTPILGSHTQLPSTTGLAQLNPHGAGARDTLAHESANAAAGTATTPTATAAAATSFTDPNRQQPQQRLDAQSQVVSQRRRSVPVEHQLELVSVVASDVAPRLST
jgi:hypothetical protein